MSWSDTAAPGEQEVPLRHPGEAVPRSWVPRSWLHAYDYMVGRDDGSVRPATADEGRAIHERIVRAWMRV